MPDELPKAKDLEQQVFLIDNENTFQQIALAVYRFQHQHNPVYQQFCKLLGKTPDVVQTLTAIPFLPISFFKTKAVKTTDFAPEIIYESSGTTGSTTSRHLVKKVDLYRKSFVKTFENFYGPVQQYTILGLLPSYLERTHSSLVFMVQDLIALSGQPLSGFYLYDFNKLYQTLRLLEQNGQKTVLIGVTYALLDFAEQYGFPLQHTTIMETGGMKGRRQEWTRQEVHDKLKNAFARAHIHSEYGMTELLSQAYAAQEGRFATPSYMKVLLREEDDPTAVQSSKHSPFSGAMNVIDLVNLYSCSFLATDDLGRLYPDGTFEVLGRMDNSDLRGCSLLAV